MESVLKPFFLHFRLMLFQPVQSLIEIVFITFGNADFRGFLHLRSMIEGLLAGIIEKAGG